MKTEHANNEVIISLTIEMPGRRTVVRHSLRAVLELVPEGDGYFVRGNLPAKVCGDLYHRPWLVGVHDKSIFGACLDWLKQAGSHPDYMPAHRRAPKKWQSWLFRLIFGN